MYFEDEFFKNEVREGFFVSSMMKRAWAAQIEILEDFEKVCNENDIKYYAAYGTLLGAVRHKGFIPWDDDIDIYMLRDDYEKLRRIAKENKLPKDFILKTIYSDNEYIATFDRLVNSQGIDFNQERMEKYHGFPFCAGLDIFPLDYVPSGKKFEEFKEDVTTLIQIYSILRRNDKEKLNKRMRELLEIKYNFKIDKKANEVNQIQRMFEKCLKKFCSNKTDKLARVYGWGANGFKEKELLDSEWFETVEHLSFENFMISAPCKYHEVLESQYKNHMVAVRNFKELHSYPFYKKQDKYFYEVVNKKISSYEFGNDNIENQASSSEFMDVKSSLLEKVKLLGRINECIINLIEIGDAGKVLDFLADSQEIAVKIGNTLEERYEKDCIKDIISNLETYCEHLYIMSMALREENDDFVDGLGKNISLVGEIGKQINDISQEYKKKIVFVFENENDWKHYEKLYGILSNEGNVICEALPIPYFLMDSNLTVDSNCLKFDGDKIKTDIEFCDYSSFEYESIDCIIKSNPYDNSSHADVIRPFYFTKNMRKYGNKIVHIPTLEIMDFTMEDVQMREMADCFVKTPSVLYSDYVLLNSKVNTNTYIEILSDISDSIKWDDRILFCSDEKEMANKILQVIND